MVAVSQIIEVDSNWRNYLKYIRYTYGLLKQCVTVHGFTESKAALSVVVNKVKFAGCTQLLDCLT